MLKTVTLRASSLVNSGILLSNRTITTTEALCRRKLFRPRKVHWMTTTTKIEIKDCRSDDNVRENQSKGKKDLWILLQDPSFQIFLPRKQVKSSLSASTDFGRIKGYKDEEISASTNLDKLENVNSGELIKYFSKDVNTIDGQLLEVKNVREQINELMTVYDKTISDVTEEVVNERESDIAVDLIIDIIEEEDRQKKSTYKSFRFRFSYLWTLRMRSINTYITLKKLMKRWKISRRKKYAKYDVILNKLFSKEEQETLRQIIRVKTRVNFSEHNKHKGFQDNRRYLEYRNSEQQAREELRSILLQVMRTKFVKMKIEESLRFVKDEKALFMIIRLLIILITHGYICPELDEYIEYIRRIFSDPTKQI